MLESVQITRHGGPEVLQKAKHPSSTLGAADVRISVKAIGVNFADVLMRLGLYPEAPPLPFTPGYEVAGIVTEIGSGVLDLKPGDEVCAATRFGGYATEAVVPRFFVHKKPTKLTLEEAAAIPVNFATAWVALQEMARVRMGDRVLIQSAAGGVGLAAIQIAAQAGAHVTAMVGNVKKADVARDFGAREVILNSEWDAVSRKEARSKFGPFDIILDAVGGENLKKCYAALGPTGRVINFGISQVTGPVPVSGRKNKRSIFKIANFLIQTPLFTPFQLMTDNRGVFGLNMLQFFDLKRQNPEFLSRIFGKIMDGFNDGHYRVQIGKVFPLEQASEAQQWLQSRENIGKVVLTV